MNRKPNRLDRAIDPDGGRTDPRKIRMDEEVRRRAVEDADRAFRRIRDDFRRMARETFGSRPRGSE